MPEQPKHHPSQVLCDWCGACPGERCTRKGRPFHHYHQARFDLLLRLIKYTATGSRIGPLKPQPPKGNPMKQTTLSSATPDEEPPERAPTQRALILDLLQAEGELTNRQLNKIGWRYSARIHELRQDGHDIQTHREKAGLYRFEYHGQAS